MLHSLTGVLPMSSKLKTFAAIASLFFGLAGCAPKETFSWIDRNCFVADWTNHHSCISCCTHGNCQHVQHPGQYPMLELGNQPADDVQAD